MLSNRSRRHHSSRAERIAGHHIDEPRHVARTAATEPHLYLPTEEVASYFVHTPPPAEHASSDRYPGLPEDIAANGILEPLTVHTDGTWAHLEDGYHRAAEAMRQGIDRLPVFVQGFDDDTYPPGKRLNPIGRGLQEDMESRFGVSPKTELYDTPDHQLLKKIHKQRLDGLAEYRRSRGIISSAYDALPTDDEAAYVEVTASDLGEALRSRIRPPSDDFGLDSEVDGTWLGNGFDALKDGVRAGAMRAIMNGYSGPPEGPDGRGWRLQKLLRDSGNPAGQDILGGELVSRAVHGDPTDAPLWRGVTHDPEYLASLQPGGSVTLPLSSFTPRFDIAKNYAQPPYDMWTSRDHPEGGVPVIYRLEPGARAARLAPDRELNPYDEHVAFGDFEIADVVPDKSWRGSGPTEIILRQRSLEPTGDWSYTGVPPTPIAAPLSEEVHRA